MQASAEATLMAVFMGAAENGQQCKASSTCNSGNSFPCLLLILSCQCPFRVTKCGELGAEGHRLTGKLLLFLYTIKLLCIGGGVPASLTEPLLLVCTLLRFGNQQHAMTQSKPLSK